MPLRKKAVLNHGLPDKKTNSDIYRVAQTISPQPDAHKWH